MFNFVDVIHKYQNDEVEGSYTKLDENEWMMDEVGCWEMAAVNRNLGFTNMMTKTASYEEEVPISDHLIDFVSKLGEV